MIKNTYIKSILLTVFAISIIGCSEDFLDKTPVQQISVSDVEKTGEYFSRDFRGNSKRYLYSMMYQTGTGGSGRHEDFGQKGI